jgi:hypothetical protein
MRLVRASHPSTVKNFVAEAQYEVTAMTGEDYESALAAGIKVEKIGQEQLPLTGTTGDKP